MKFETNFKNEMRNYLYGRNPLLSFVSSGDITKIFLQNGFKNEVILKNLEKYHLKPIYVDVKELDRMTGGANHQGVVFTIKPYQYSSLDEIIKCAKNKERPIILLIDEVNDPANFGAMIRSADAFGVDGIIIKSKNQVLVTPATVKSSTGATRFVKIAVVNNLSNAIKKLKDNGYWIYAADGSAKDNYLDLKYDRPTGLILGSEGFGISRLVLENSDFIIKIPMCGHVNSLNVSVACGILLSYIRNNK